MAHHDLYHERCLYGYLGIRKLLKGQQDTSGCSFPSLSPVLIFLPSGRGKEGTSIKIERFGATCVSNTTIRYNCQESGLRVSGSIIASSETRTANTVIFPCTQTHMANKLHSSASCLPLHFCLHRCCACCWAHTPSPLSERG